MMQALVLLNQAASSGSALVACERPTPDVFFILCAEQARKQEAMLVEDTMKRQRSFREDVRARPGGGGISTSFIGFVVSKPCLHRYPRAFHLHDACDENSKAKHSCSLATGLDGHSPSDLARCY